MASSLNRVTLIGNLTREPELKQTSGGKSVASFSLATNQVYKSTDGQKHEQADFHSCVAWGKLADICAQYLTKGKKVYVDGRLQTREWEGQDGQKRYRTEIVLENMIMLGDKRQTTQLNPEPQPYASDDQVRLEDIPF